MSRSKLVSDRTAKKRLLQLADFLQYDVPQEHFNFSTFGTAENGGKSGLDILAEENRNYCGTQACALGWAPALPFAKRLGYKLVVAGRGTIEGTKFTKNGRTVSIGRMAKELFGLNETAWSYIFYSSVLNGDDGYATAEKVAESIRDFVAIRFG